MASMESIINQEKAYEIEDGLLTCHIDGMYTPSGFLHEGKTTNAWSFDLLWGEPGTDKIPIEYQTQVQHQMLCTGAEKAIVSVLVFPKRPDQLEKEGINIPIEPIRWAGILCEMGFFHQYEVEANVELHALMRDEYLRWWEEHIVGRKPPEIRTYQDARKLIRAPSGTILAGEKLERWATEYKQIGSEVATAGKRKDELKALILAECQKGAAVEDEASSDKWLIVNDQGKKLFSYNGKAFR
jgi:hypothetical protein